MRHPSLLDGPAGGRPRPARLRSGPTPELDEVIVTATRLPAIVADTPGARVIDAATIEQRGAVFAADILSRHARPVGRAGRSLRRRGPGPHPRGHARQDPDPGRRRAGQRPGRGQRRLSTSPASNWATSSGSRCCRGPQSSLWGSDAIGGVIAFTTREVDGVRAEAEAGSFDTLRGRLAAGVANDDLCLRGLGLALRHRRHLRRRRGRRQSRGRRVREHHRRRARPLCLHSPSVQIDGSVRWSTVRGRHRRLPGPALRPRRHPGHHQPASNGPASPALQA